VVLAHDHDEAIKAAGAGRRQAEPERVSPADGPVNHGPVWVLAGFGAPAPQNGQSL